MTTRNSISLPEARLEVDAHLHRPREARRRPSRRIWRPWRLSGASPLRVPRPAEPR
ncbi:MAG: hypothetical protein M0C28_27995 [Candidatus Moduliflexus flocculans]|nr:hypothetical protein [Candidatus Moduliflexus flocculans]